MTRRVAKTGRVKKRGITRWNGNNFHQFHHLSPAYYYFIRFFLNFVYSVSCIISIFFYVISHPYLAKIIYKICIICQIIIEVFFPCLSIVARYRCYDEKGKKVFGKFKFKTFKLIIMSIYFVYNFFICIFLFCFAVACCHLKLMTNFRF